MKVSFVCDGKPERIPEVGSRIKIKDGLEFEIDGYGENRETKSTLYQSGVMYEIELDGHFVIPKGTSLDVFNEHLQFLIKTDGGPKES